MSRLSGGILRAIGATLALCLLAIAFYLIFDDRAGAHDFYSEACCSDRDCRVAVFGDVTWTPVGYRVLSTDETIPLNDPRIQYSPPGEPGYRLCVPDYDVKVKCLYIPEHEG